LFATIIVHSEMKRNTVMLAVAFSLFHEPRNYITEILTLSLACKPCACNKLMTSVPSPFKNSADLSDFGKVAKIALGERSPLVAAPMENP